MRAIDGTTEGEPRSAPRRIDPSARSDGQPCNGWVLTGVIRNMINDPGREVGEASDRVVAGTAVDDRAESTCSIATVSVPMDEAAAIRFVGVDPVAYRVRPDGTIDIELA